MLYGKPRTFPSFVAPVKVPSNACLADSVSLKSVKLSTHMFTSSGPPIL